MISYGQATKFAGKQTPLKSALEKGTGLNSNGATPAIVPAVAKVLESRKAG